MIQGPYTEKRAAKDGLRIGEAASPQAYPSWRLALILTILAFEKRSF
jgi:hypothetical protein